MNFNQKIAGASYRPDIDGLRAIAVLPVVFFHAGLGFPGGYVGVDIFFVISGYLITQIIFREIQNEEFSFLNFYERRARRILPALFSMIALTTVGAWLLLLPQDFSLYGKSLVATLLFFANFFFSSSLGDYFSSEAEFQLLLHTWSLAVEEQFYIVFPFILILPSLLARSLKRGAIVLTLGLTVLSFVVSVATLRTSAVEAFYYSPGRAWELGIGALLALGLHDIAARKAYREVFAVVGLTLVIWAIFTYDKQTTFPGAAALSPCLGTALMIWSGRQGPTLVSRLLAMRPFVYVGLISYSLYLMHWPIMALLRNYTGFVSLSVRDAWVAIILSFLAAIFSWAVIERPFRLKSIVGRRTLVTFSLGGGLVVGALAAGLIWGNGLPSRFPANVQSFAAGLTDRNPRREACFDTWPETGLCQLGMKNQEPSFLFWGDSHADALMPGVDLAAEKSAQTGLFLAHGGCAPVLGVYNKTISWAETCKNLYTRIANALSRSEPGGLETINQVILYARWSVAGNMTAFDDAKIPLVVAQDGGLALFDYGLSKTIDLIRASDREVVLILGTPEFGWNVPSKLVNQVRFGKTPPPSPTSDVVAEMNADLLTVLKKYSTDSGVRVVSLNDVLCAPDCMPQKDGHPLYVDGNHLSAYAAEHVLASVLSDRIWPEKN